MPRNSAGAFSLVAGNPVVTDTPVSSTWANDTLNDIAAEIQDSLSRSGKGGMLVPMEFADGTAADPAITFSAAPTTGLYRAGTNDVRFSLAGSDLVQLAATVIKFIARVADGATAIGLTIDTVNALTTAGAKLLSVLNHAVEKFSIDKDGAVVAGAMTGTAPAATVAASDGQNGVTATGGVAGGDFGYSGGSGVVGTGADENGSSDGGSGGVFTGGDSDGVGVVATGGSSGTGLVASGGATNGTGIIAYGYGTAPGIKAVNDGGTRAPLNLAPHSTPSTLENGDIWIDSITNTLMVRIDGISQQVMTTY